MMKRLIVLVLLASALLTGCNTARGFGEDIKHLGNSISRAASLFFFSSEKSSDFHHFW
ncbi:TPA: lipoprotein antitoxin entericidin A [Escherichia coli]|nr:lipoprotein antitoxin entericidin A [Escherichia coli]HAJ4944608.1 lipoprotein antitoxin entericidin A [Escherichia coli]